MKLKDYLAVYGLTVPQFAREAEISAEGLRLILKGKRQARRKTADRIHDASRGKVTRADLAAIQPSGAAE